MSFWPKREKVNELNLNEKTKIINLVKVLTRQCDIKVEKHVIVAYRPSCHLCLPTTETKD